MVDISFGRFFFCLFFDNFFGKPIRYQTCDYLYQSQLRVESIFISLIIDSKNGNYLQNSYFVWSALY